MASTIISFLRCGYSLSEIEEAAALSLNYRKQMTLTKLLEAPEQMKDAVKNRFASTQEPAETNGQSSRHRISRRHSMEPLRPPRREPEIDYPAESCYCTAPYPHHLDGPPSSGPSRFTMPRRLSNIGPGPEDGLIREGTESGPWQGIESGPWRATTSKKFERRNSPTAEPPASPLRRPTLPLVYSTSLDQSLPQLPSRTFSPESEKRNNLRRHKSAPLSKIQGLKMPVRTVSPIPPPKSGTSTLMQTTATQ